MRKAIPRGLFGILLWICAHGAASEGPPPILNPRTYSSPSGHYKLSVDPSAIEGQREGSYQLTCDGQVVWEGKRPFTFWDAAAGDDGVVAGYGYSQGWRTAREPGDFQVVILDPAGKARVHVVVPRQPSRFFHTPPDPLATGMVFDAEHDRLIVRVRNEDLNARGERWWMYRVSTGEALGKVEALEHVPDAESVRSIMDVRAVPGTDLLLVHGWLYRDGVSTDAGARFFLLDPHRKPVWTLDLMNDYAGDAGRREIREQPAILRCDEPGRFELRFVKDAQRVMFEVRTDRGAVKVTEQSRQAFLRDEPKPAPIPEIELRHVGTIKLAGAPMTQPVRDICNFAFDDQDRIAFLRHEPGQGMTFVLLDARGNVVQEIHPEGFGGSDSTSEVLAWVGGSRWIIADAPYGPNAKARAWWIDIETGRFEAVSGFDCYSVEAMAGSGDGGFVVLARHDQQSTITHELIGFDKHARQRWRIGHEFGGGATNISCPRGMTVTSKGTSAVLDGDMKLFNRFGNPAGVIELARATNNAALHYPAELGADTEGGIILYDFSGKPLVWRFRADGTLRETLDPRYADGKTFALRDAIKAAPDGRLWTSDGDALLRLDAKGVVDRIIGAPPDATVLAKIGAMTVDSAGRIYAADARAGTVHVFNRDGRRQSILTPLPGDFQSNDGPDQITVAGDRSVYIAARNAEPRGYLRFDPQGKRDGFSELGIDRVVEVRHFVPNSMRCWVRGYQKIHLVGVQGTVELTIERCANRNWLEVVGDLAVAPDGSLAAVAGGDPLFARSRTGLNLYTPEGKPVRTIPLPGGQVSGVSYTGRHVVVGVGSSVLLATIDGTPLQRFRPRGQTAEAYWEPLPSPEPGELWLWEHGTRQIERYALPG